MKKTMCFTSIFKCNFVKLYINLKKLLNQQPEFLISRWFLKQPYDAHLPHYLGESCYFGVLYLNFKAAIAFFFPFHVNRLWEATKSAIWVWCIIALILRKDRFVQSSLFISEGQFIFLSLLSALTNSFGCNSGVTEHILPVDLGENKY